MNTLKTVTELMPRTDIWGYNGYSMDAVDKFKQIIKLIKNEPNKQIRFECFAKLMKKVESFRSNFAAPSHDDRSSESYKARRAKETKEVLAMLRSLKKLHFDINYTPGCMITINSWIRSLGGTVMTKEQMQANKTAKLVEASNKIEAGEKVPRKKKKEIERGMAKLGYMMFKRRGALTKTGYTK